MFHLLSISERLIPKDVTLGQNKNLSNCYVFCWWLHLGRLMTKPTQWLCAQRSLRSAWASAQSDQSSLCAQWEATNPISLHAGNEDSDQTGQMLRQNWVFAGSTCHFVGFVMRRLIIFIIIFNMSRAMRKCVLCHMRTTKVQISLRIRAVWSEPLLFAA